MTVEIEYQIGPALAAMREAMGMTQDQVAKAGGPSPSEQTRMAKGGADGNVSSAHLSKYRIAFENLGRRDVADALPALERLMEADGLPEVDRPVTLEPGGVIFHHAANRNVILGPVDVDTVRLQTEEPLTKEQRITWGIMTWGLLNRADLIFVEQEGRPAPITEEYVDRPSVRFRSSAYNDVQRVLAVDPLKTFLDLYGKRGAPPLGHVRAFLACLTEGRATRSSWTPMLLSHLLNKIAVSEDREQAWPSGPLSQILAAGAGERPRNWPARSGEIDEAWRELIELLTPFQDSILDAVDEVEASGPLDTGKPPVVHLLPSAITSIEELRRKSRRDEAVAFGPGVAGQARLLAAMACDRDSAVLTVRGPHSLVVARPVYSADLPIELTLRFVPGMSTVAYAHFRGETTVVRVHPG